MGLHMRAGRCCERAGGFTYLGLLIAIAVMSVGLLAASAIWVTALRRQQAAELEWVGGQFVQAIGSYYDSSPGSVKVYPTSLAELLEDRRFLTMRRHLRQIYRNPFSGKPDWEPITAAEGGVVGIRARITSIEGQLIREFVHRP